MRAVSLPGTKRTAWAQRLQLQGSGGPLAASLGVALGLIAALLVFVIGETSPFDFVTLLGLAALSSLVPLGGIEKAVRPMGGTIAISIAVVVIGPGAGSWVGVLASLFGWFHFRYGKQWLWAELLACAWVPVVVGAAFYWNAEMIGLDRSSYWYLLLIAGWMVIGFILFLLIVAGYEKIVEGTPFARLWRDLSRWNARIFIVASALTVAISFVALHEGSIGLLVSCGVVIFGQGAWATINSLARQTQILRQRSEQLTTMQFALLRALIESLNLRDPHAADHAAHTAAYARDLAARIGLSERQRNLVHAAGVLHDIGKYSFPDELFDLPSDLLDKTAREIIQRHPEEGAAIVAQISGYAEVARIIASHHERPDGSGYPAGLSGSSVPVLAQIVGICEAYDMMVRGTLYRPPVPWQQALKSLQSIGFRADLRSSFQEMIREADDTYRNASFTDFHRELAVAEGFMRTL